MNTVTASTRRKANTLSWLIRREYWENRGGFLWAPLTSAIITLLLMMLLSLFGTVHFQTAVRHDAGINVSGNLTGNLPGSGALGDVLLWMGIAPIAIALTFAVFFYALGSLYDDRRDRSILFWKSLPISDTEMVVAKVICALILAPLISLIIALLLGFCMWLIAGLVVLINGVGTPQSLFVNSHPLQIILKLVCALPVQIAWAFPTIGWLMFCSAWSRSIPFTWAAMIPILSCVVISMMGILPGVSIPSTKIWYTVVFRGLLSIVPGSWMLKDNTAVAADVLPSANNLISYADVFDSWRIFATLDLWLGVITGLVFIAAAIYFRRWRDEG
ncbi:MAG: ABC transporter permease [Xanthomonadaceae bacterium]|jgi:ABC-2 type transport system permease protein|nr:ABC transporter permease [Xanthomonadaceae bacterium]